MSQGNGSHASEFSERLQPSAPFDGPGDSLRQEQPPWDDVPIPGVDDHVNILVEQVSINDDHFHAVQVPVDIAGLLGIGPRCLLPRGGGVESGFGPRAQKIPDQRVGLT